MNLEALISAGVSDVSAEAIFGTLARERIQDADIPADGDQIRSSSVVVVGKAAGVKRLDLPDPATMSIGEGEEVAVYNAREGNHNVEVYGFAEAGNKLVIAQHRFLSFVFVGGVWANN